MMIIQQTPQEIQDVDPTTSAITSKDKKKEEDDDLTTNTTSEEDGDLCVATPVQGLNCFDVICGRCSLAFNNVGNRRFRIIISMNLQRYIDAPTRPAKGKVILSVVRVFQEELGAKFVKQTDDGEFVPVSSKIVRQKVGHALRDLAAQKGGDDTRSLPNNYGSTKYQHFSTKVGRSGKCKPSFIKSTLVFNDPNMDCGDRSISSADLSTQSEPIVSKVRSSSHCSSSSFLSSDPCSSHEKLESSPVYSMGYCETNFYVNGGGHMDKCTDFLMDTEKSNIDHIDELVDKVLLGGEGTRESFFFDCTPIPL